MDEKKAVEIIKSLAMGFDPETKQMIPDLGPFNNRVYLGALWAVINLAERQLITPPAAPTTVKLNVTPKKETTKPAGQENSRKRWTPADDEALGKAYEAKTFDINATAKEFKRTVSAIVSRLTHLKLIDEDSELFQQYGSRRYFNRGYKVGSKVDVVAPQPVTMDSVNSSALKLLLLSGGPTTVSSSGSVPSSTSTNT